MRRLLFLLALLLAGPVAAQSTYPTAASGAPRVAGVVPLSCDTNGANCAPTTSSNPLPVGGTVAAAGTQARGASITANPVVVGGRGSSSAPSAVTSGQVVDQWLSLIGGAFTHVADTSGNVAATSNPTTGTSNQRGLATFSQTMYAQGNSTTQEAAFSCPSTAAINVTAGNTTEIVALTAAQTIRVCSISVGISASGTVGVVYGTGTNCGTGTTTLVTDMNLTSGNIWALASGGGTSLFRGASANALCVKAVTGNVTGYLTYAKF